MMAKIRCETGYTQIERVLSHASREGQPAKSAPWSMSEMPARKTGDAANPPRELGDLGIPVFMFQEGYDLRRRERFQEIAEADARGLSQL